MLIFYSIYYIFFILLFYIIPTNISIIYSFFGTLFLFFFFSSLGIVLYNNDTILIDHYLQNKINWLDYLNLNINFSLNKLSLLFILLTLLINLTILLYLNNNYSKNNLFAKNNKLYIFLFLILQNILILTFLINNFFWFYVLFETILIPMYLIIGIWGSKTRKIKASYYLFYYTLISSTFLLVALIYIYFRLYIINVNFFINNNLFANLLNTGITLNISLYFTFFEQLILFLMLFLPFIVKIPTCPFHIWLPEAHVEAPTVGSVLLASILLKLGGFGLYKFILPLFAIPLLFFNDFILMLIVLSSLYAAFLTLIQEDLKKTIAYSSIVHMNMGLIGFFMYNLTGITSFIYLMVSHAFISGALFFLIGFIYDRLKTRIRIYISGLVLYMPLLSFFFFLNCFANVGFPGTIGFIGEVLLFLSLVKTEYIDLYINSCSFYYLLFANLNYIVLVLICFLITVLTLQFTISLFNNIFFGSDLKLINLLKEYLNGQKLLLKYIHINNLARKSKHIFFYKLFLYKCQSSSFIKYHSLRDLSKIEFYIMFILLFFVIYFGFKPNFILFFN